MTTRFRLIEVPSAATSSGGDGWMLTGMHQVERADKLLVYGHADYAAPLRNLELDLADQTYERRRWAVVVASDAPTTVVGMVRVGAPLADNTHLTWSYLCVHPDWRRRGVGTILLDWAEAASTAEGRTTWLHWIDLGLPEPGAPTVAAPEGGAIAAAEPGWRFAEARGYTLEQIEQLSVLELPAAARLVDQLAAEAAAHTDGYRLHTWLNTIPAEWRQSYADLLGEFLKEAPTAGLDFTEEHYDVARLEATIGKSAERGGTWLIAAAEHVESGRLVATTELESFVGTTAMGQGITLVLPAHRGHRLGTWIKCANLRQLAREAPQVRRIHTGNAAENEHMLAINIALGFRPEGAEATLRKVAAT